MKENPKTKRNIFNSLGVLVGLCCVAWLIFTLKNVSSGLVNHTDKQKDYLIPAITPSDDKALIKQGLHQAKNSLEQVETVTSDDLNNVDNVESEQCLEQCSVLLSILDEDLELEDEAFEKLEAYVGEIAVYLQGDERKRQHYVQMALTTTDADKRSFLTEVFKHLPDEQKIEIGADFIDSENWRLRADGVTLIADQETIDQSVADVLIDILSIEKNSYVKGSILTSLEHSPNLQGNPKILQQLNDVINYESDFSVRKAALNAKMNLSEQPHHILPDAIKALRTSDPEFQLAGLIAISQILDQERKYVEAGAYIDKAAIKNNLENILNTDLLNNGNEDHLEFLIKEADNLYMRHFHQPNG